jgi:hypothetical protein
MNFLRLSKNIKLWKPLVQTNVRSFSYSKELIENLDNSTINNLTPIETVLKYVRGFPIFPLGLNVVDKNYVKIMFRFGKPDGYITEGFTYIYPFGNVQYYFCGDRTINNNDMQLTDSNKNPILLSTFLTYNIINPVNNYVNLRAKLEENENHGVLKNWLENMIRNIVSQFSYDELTLSNSMIKDKIRNEINSHENCELYGIKIKEFGILGIKYSPEILETMLVKQRVNATLNARKEIAETTLSMITDITDKLGDKLSEKDKSKLITCLTVAMIGNQSPAPIVSI